MVERIYWDANDFISRLDRTPDRIAVLEQITDYAEKGEITIVTSAISLLEVAKVVIEPPLTPEEQERLIVDFFENP